MSEKNTPPEKKAANSSVALGETSKRGTLIAWIVVIGIAVLMLARGFVSQWLIGDYGLSWDYLTVPYVPAEGYSSTSPTPRPKEVPKQVELPPSPLDRKTK